MSSVTVLKEECQAGATAETLLAQTESEENIHVGSSFDDFLEEEGILNECSAIAIKRVIAWQIKQEMEQKQLSQTKMADCLKTSRSSLKRLLDPENTSVTLHTLDKAASVLGKKLKIDFVDIEES